LGLAGGAVADAFLDPGAAFKPHVEVREGRVLAVTWEIAEGYKLYRESLSAKATPALPTMRLPEGRRGFDEALGKEVTTYQKAVTGQVTLPTGAREFTLEIGFQGCAIEGFCYPPQTRLYRVDPARVGLQTDITPPEDIAESGTTVPAAAAVAPEADRGRSVVGTASATIVGAGDDASTVQRVLQGGSLITIALSFLLFGLLLSFTPCVLPMIPILSSIIVGQQAPSRGRSFMLAVSYSLGMALVYTALGVAAGLVGEGLAAFMQQPVVLGVFALMLSAFALSMFDVYQLQLPASWQGGVSEVSGRFQGGKYLGVFAMGAVSSLIVGPCVAGPLAGALLYISQTRDVLIGGFALFAMACGMSVPLLLTGLSAGSLLPKAGMWMNHVKTVFGFMLLAVALWMVNPLLGDNARLMAWGALLVLAAFFTPLLSPRDPGEGFFTRAGRMAGVLVLVTGLAEFTGGLMGNSDPLAPLSSRQVLAAAAPGRTTHVEFERISGAKALDAALRASDRPVVLDFYADWCASCLEMEKLTFRDSKVVERMQSWRRLQVDVTKNTPEDRELMRRFRLFGPPALVFFSKEGLELEHLRLIGYLGAKPFLDHLDKAIPQKDL
ncbi:MAG: hypothetical protein RIS35_3660, partial [Pseudomonadota bacterium]